MIRLPSVIVLAASIGLAQETIPKTAATTQTMSESPERVDRPGLVFDTKRRKLVLFGGGFGDKMRGETWKHDGKTWFNRRIPGRPNTIRIVKLPPSLIGMASRMSWI